MPPPTIRAGALAVIVYFFKAFFFAMQQLFFENPELGYLTIGTAAAFVMAFLRCLRFNRGDMVMVVTESIMCAMIAGSIVMGVRSMWHIAFVWAVPIGVTVGFIGTSFIHMVIKRLIEFQVGRFTGGASLPDTQNDKKTDNKLNDAAKKG